MNGPPETTNPAATAMANGVLVGAYPSRKRPKDPSSKPRDDKPKLTVKVAVDGPTITVTGRNAQTLELLIQSGPTGFTSGEASPFRWARRTSAYIHDLRSVGIPITTRRETTPDGASVARYALAGPVVVVNGGEA